MPLGKCHFRLLAGLLLFVLIASDLQAAPKVRLVPMDFLGGFGPGKMCQTQFIKMFGDKIAPPRMPLGGALVKIDKGSSDLYMYIFCDPSLYRLVIFQEERSCGMITALGIREYGDYYRATHFANIDDSTDSLGNPISSAGVFGAPIDVVTSSAGSYYEPDRDFIYVLDRDYHKIIRLRYDVTLDSIIWVDTFGGESLRFPTSIANSDYNDQDTTNEKIYVTDSARHEIIRFSRSGVRESQWGFANDNTFTGMINPVGVTVAEVEMGYDGLFVCSGNWPTIMKFSSLPNQSIQFKKYGSFNYKNPVTSLCAVAADWQGDIYMANNPGHSIMVISDTLLESHTTLGPAQMEPAPLCFPTDIHIDGDEMQVCELWGDSTGIASYKIIPDSTIPVIERIPKRYHLYPVSPLHFMAQTKIPFDVPILGHVQLSILDKSGETVKTLLNINVPAGNQAVVWDGRNETGEFVEEGIYKVKMVTADYDAEKPVLYIK